MAAALLRDDSKRAEDNGRMLQQEKFWLDVKENVVHSVDGWALEQVPYKSCRISIIGDTLHSSGCNTEKPAQTLRLALLWVEGLDQVVSRGLFQPKLLYKSKLLGLVYQRQLAPNRLPVPSQLERIYCCYLIWPTSNTWFLTLANHCAGLWTLRTQDNLCLGQLFPSKETDCEPGTEEMAITVKSALPAMLMAPLTTAANISPHSVLLVVSHLLWGQWGHGLGCWRAAGQEAVCATVIYCTSTMLQPHLRRRALPV